jgi:TonB-linked SusC/RagA family outer membrane protein
MKKISHFPSILSNRQYSKTLLIMRLSLVLLLATLINVSANTYSQNSKLSFNLHNVTVKDVLNEIEKTSPYKFIYRNEFVDVQQVVNVNAKEETLETIMAKLFNSEKIAYRVFEGNIVVITDKSLQQIKVTGTVKDGINGDLLPGVNVIIKGTSTGVTTDINGKYTIEVPNNEAVLVFSFIGYNTESVPVAGQSTIDINLVPDIQSLQEVVVVGFGTQKKVNLTGAVGVATAKDFEARPVQSAVMALQGIIPGLNITNSGNGGELNATKSINIRGIGTVGKDASGNAYTSGSPLILIDGMEGDINTVNPQDIESVSVLKDAAASSIYGSRAPFGVILITTKSGKKGRAVINYNNSFRYNTPIFMPQMANSWEFVNYFDDANFNSSNNHWYPNISYMQKVKDYYDGKLNPNDVVWSADGTGRNGSKWNYDWSNGNVDWLKEYYKDWSPSQEHNLSISGGSEKLSYYLSGNFMAQDGFMRHGTDKFNRYTLTAKLSSKVTDNLQVDYSSRYVRTDFGRPSSWNDGFYDNILRRARPTRSIYDPNGYYMADNNYILAMENGGRQKEQNDGLSQQIKATLSPLKNWNLIAEMNVKTGNNWTHWDVLKTYAHYADVPEATYVPTTTSATQDEVYEYSYRSTFLNPNIYTNYKISLGNHNITALAGFQAEQMKQRQLNAQRKDLINPDQPVLNLTTNSAPTINGEYQEWSTAGFFGRINYDYMGKYLLELNLRYDGSSRYRADQRWVWTPSASVGWNVAKESFFESLGQYIQLLKIRASYGSLANQNTTNWYPTYVTMGTGATDSRWLVDGARVNTASAPGLISTSLTWEKIYDTNVGLDVGAFNSRLTGSFDYFIRKTKDMVGTPAKLPLILGTAVPVTNNCDLTTYGWELEIGWKDKIKDFKYGVSLNISDSRTRIDRFANPTKNLGTYIEGELTGNIYGYTTVGIAKTDQEMQDYLATMPNGGQNAEGSNWTAGDIMYADLNEDGKLGWGNDALDNMGDKSLIGNNTPRYRTGISIDASWKGFDFQMLWQGVLKRDFMPGESDEIFWGVTNAGQWWSTAFKTHLDYFRANADHPLGQNLNSYYPRPLFGSNKNHKSQTRYLQNAAYMRLKNLQFGYTLPQKWVSKIKVQNIRLYVSGENLLTITKLTEVFDPESAGVGRRGGSNYPLSKTYSFGLSVNF